MEAHPLYLDYYVVPVERCVGMSIAIIKWVSIFLYTLNLTVRIFNLAIHFWFNGVPSRYSSSAKEEKGCPEHGMPYVKPLWR